MNIKEELDKYLEFDSSELFEKRYSDFAAVFGGAIRDIVAGDASKINDIDILTMPHTGQHIMAVLEMNGYKRMDLIKPDLVDIYKKIDYIFLPLTYINENRKVVQLIRPHNKNITNRPPNEFQLLRQNYYALLANVDLTSSGLFYDGEELYESVKHAYIHCKVKRYEILPDAMMYNEERTNIRSRKLDNRWDWKIINTDDLMLMRKLKIESILPKDKIPTLDDYIDKKRDCIKRR